jgi:hypothetical protein
VFLIIYFYSYNDPGSFGESINHDTTIGSKERKMAIKLINKYQAWWDASTNSGFFWFTYFDGVRSKSISVNAESFAIITDLLRNEKPVYGDHTKALVTTQSEEVGEEES